MNELTFCKIMSIVLVICITGAFLGYPWMLAAPLVGLVAVGFIVLLLGCIIVPWL